MNKLICLTILFLFISTVFSDCLNHEHCRGDEDGEYCNLLTGECSTCINNVHEMCSFDSYCKALKDDKYECTKYSDDERLGEFCNNLNNNDCESHFCGVCDDDNVVIWHGECIDFKCRSCVAGDHSSGIAGQHRTAGCYPTQSYGTNGRVLTKQTAGLTPKSFSQTSLSLGFFFFGFLLLGVLIMNVLLCLKSK
ncbi:hypothetical protein M0812_10823 [Anaeramoeba flamelloides]|uniref:Uncharacterized protein n=1 Tax=Anaeramoeba flamelloides TaxID=1746091 RepID=A0AAV7ZSI5_9EUKA|nr:hypothetical protein M0812_10823 [Anaeramoeba flamelloides]